MNAANDKGRVMRWVVILSVAALALLHQDFWWWDDATLLCGFLPIGLAYHALFTIVAATVWALAVKYAWPAELEEEPQADGEPREGSG